MEQFPEELHYTKDHEWIRVEGGIGTVGITFFAQEQLGDVVHVELPRTGTSYQAHESFGEVESVKTFSELFIPVSGEITETNEELENSPQLVNEEPYGNGWMIKVKMSDKSEIDGLLSSSEYKDFVESQKED